MKDPFADWPPIIRASKVGRAVLLRDLLLTLLMWAMLVFILYTELRFTLDALMVLMGRSDAQIDAELALFWRRMQPLIWLIGGLVLMLAVATLVSIIRRNRALRMTPPVPLADATLAELAGMDATTLETARSTRRMLIRRVEGQGLVIEQAQRASAAAPTALP